MSTFIGVLIIVALLALITFQGVSLVKLLYSKFKKLPEPKEKDIEESQKEQ